MRSVLALCAPSEPGTPGERRSVGLSCPEQMAKRLCTQPDQTVRGFAGWAAPA